MNAIEIITKIRAAGGSIVVENGEIKISAPVGSLTQGDRSVLAEHRDRLSEIIGPLDPERAAIQWADTPAANRALAEARREWTEDTATDWPDLFDADLEYLLSPRQQPEPCPWCGGRTVHSEPCKELRRSWLPELTCGKHKGRRLDETPSRYLRRLLREVDLQLELRRAIEEIVA